MSKAARMTYRSRSVRVSFLSGRSIQRPWIQMISFCIMALSASLWMKNTSTIMVVQAGAVEKETSFMYGNEKGYSKSYVLTEFGYLGQMEQHAPPPLVASTDRKNNHVSFQEPASNVQPGTQYIVEFYNPWCGACQAYKKHYLEVAKDVLEELEKNGGDQNFYFYAVSCEAYVEVCRDMEIEGFPMVKYFAVDGSDEHANTKANKGQLLKRTETVKDYIVDKVRAYQKEHKEKNNNIVSDGTAEKDASDVSGDADSSDLADEDGNNRDDKHKSLTELLTYSISLDDSDIDDINLQRDTYLSVLYTLEYSVFTTSTGPLSAEKAHALHDWLELIHHSIPPRWTTLTALVENVLSKHFEATQSFDKLKQHATLITPFVSDMTTKDGRWSDDCAHPQKSQSGYTCGLWKLFHTVSVGVARGSFQDAERRVRITPKVGAQCIRDMVDFFFGCLECREHFLQMYGDCDGNDTDDTNVMFDRCNLLFDEDDAPYDDDPKWIEMALYFWKVHNSVNRRVYIEALELDNEALPSDTIIDDETAWPSVARCSGCRKADGSWSEKHVFLYLQKELWGVTGPLSSVEQHQDSGHTSTFTSTGANPKDTKRKVNKLGAATTPMLISKASSSSIRSGGKNDDNTASSSSSSSFRGILFCVLLLGIAFCTLKNRRSPQASALSRRRL